MGLWSEHGTSWYNCNRFEEKSGSEARTAQARSRASLERYLHYYNRYANHEQSAKLDKDLYLKTEKKMTSLQSQSDLSWIEVQFLDTASQTLQLCRQTLKWTYAFAYYLARNNITEIFEENQKDLELAVENLSEMFEKPVPELAKLKGDILDKTAYCNKRRVVLLTDTAENLKKGKLEQLPFADMTASGERMKLTFISQENGLLMSSGRDLAVYNKMGLNCMICVFFSLSRSYYIPRRLSCIQTPDPLLDTELMVRRKP